MIPMQAPVESLNVAIAAALVLYEAARQRATTVPVERSTNVAL
jgi:tRNA G18 (ribose-2'-O)-methylase SpoU